MIELDKDEPETPPEHGVAEEGEFPGIIVRREAGPKQMRWDRPLVVAMILAAVGGFGVAVAMSGVGKPKPAAVAKVDDEDGQPTRLMQIQVQNAPVKAPAGLTGLMPAPVAPSAEAPAVVASAAPAPAPAPQPTPAATTPAAPSAPQAPPRAAPALDLDALADPEMANADRALEGAFREARAAGVPPRDLQAERRAWEVARAQAASRSRGALLDAYQDRIDDLRDLADDAGRTARSYDRRYDRYADGRDDDDPAYAPPYRGYGRPSGN